MMKFICLQLYRSVDLITPLIIFDVDFSFANNTEHNYPQFTLFELKQRGRSDVRLSSVCSMAEMEITPEPCGNNMSLSCDLVYVSPLLSFCSALLLLSYVQMSLSIKTLAR